MAFQNNSGTEPGEHSFHVFNEMSYQNIIGNIIKVFDRFVQNVLSSGRRESNAEDRCLVMLKAKAGLYINLIHWLHAGFNRLFAVFKNNLLVPFFKKKRVFFLKKR